MTVGDQSWSKGSGPVAMTTRARAALAPLGHDGVRLEESGLLGGWQRRTLQVTLPYVLDHLEGGEAQGNLARLLGGGDPSFVGMVFTDSDIYKALEAVAWAAIGLEPGDDRLLRAERLVELLALVQQPDGYLNSWVQGSPGVERWSDPQWGHELYTAGHLFQAAVAAARAGVLPGLLPLATRFADLLVERFDAPTSEYLDGHPQVETALVELYRVTGTEGYLRLAGRQVDLRGYGRLGEDRFGSAYFQDAIPVRAATEATGHAVRQLYLLTGAVDVAVETHDDELLAAAVRIWTELWATKTYVTGALGSRHRDEAIGDPHELPPDRAYAETCAAIASFQLGWRLLLATGQAHYADQMETVLYNAIAASTSADGDRFFYSNPLHLRTGHEGSQEDAPSQRLPWFSCACCPPNVARLMASVHDYLVTTSADGIQVQHPSAGRADVPLLDGIVRLKIRTDYPHSGSIDLEVSTEITGEWELALRIPSWCNDFQVLLDGEPMPVEAPDGYLRIRRCWPEHIRVQLTLLMPVRRIKAHPRVDAVRGCVALARGPLVYALEDADLPPNVVLEDVRLLEVREVDEIDDGDGTPRLNLLVAGELALQETLYVDQPASSEARVPPKLSEPFQIGIGPYYHWANRTPGAMRVWIPTCFREETP
jgi:hypothetical protein